ncbi:MAG: tetratricopeptide repeat protein [Armatimonadota bacterium]|nr:tetratricopeptide repeat protein [Armatimonadota bacterium]MDR7444610.1 tetratricopeptide repeat protein [Armatimonadota bacterium]MDR7569436.1 tetratricopeptide repeat protein [Armatimonadota bacterium]MDR7613681.1 tetratricopeptide repeat protein [Armatimonadota bacterium]
MKGRQNGDQLRQALLRSKPGPGPDCPDDLTVFHAAAGLLSHAEQQAFERHLEGCLACRDRELETRKLLHFEQHRIPYRIDPQTGRIRRVSRIRLLLSALHPQALLRGLTDLAPKRLAIALAFLLVALLAWSLASPALARSPAVLAAAKQVPVVRWLLPASVREYLEASLLADRMGRLPLGGKEWQDLAARAEGHLKRALRMDPAYVDAHILLGDLYLDRSSVNPASPASRRYLDLAEAAYRRALIHDPQHIQARYGLAEVYATRGEFGKELEQYNAILRQDPNEHDARLFRGWVYLERGDYARAAEDFRELLKEDPTDWEAAWALGLARAFEGKPREALREVERLKPLNPGRARLLQHILRALEKAGRR